MPIEFYCPGCGNLMRTPDETAGRKGRCPTCQLKVQIPGSSVASTSSETAVPRTATAASSKGTKPEPIRFDCGICGKALSIPATNAGKKGQCPHCGQTMSIPLKSPGSGKRWKGGPKPQSTSSTVPSPAPATKQQPSLVKAGGEKIEFRCSSCNEVVRVGVAAAGKRGQCPRCKAVVQIPLKTTTAPATQRAPSNKPVPPRPQPKPAAPSSGLTPLPNQDPASSGLRPVDAFDALSPLEPLGLTPLGPLGADPVGDDLFGGDLFGSSSMDDDNPFAQNSNPYSAPRPVPAREAAKRSSGRSGTEIATMICGGCLTCYAVAQIFFTALTLFMQSATSFAVLDRLSDQGEDAAFAIGTAAGQIAAVIVSGAVMFTILAGGIQMIRFKVWGLCMAACILTMMPCNCFCLLGLPIGIWGMIMLSLGSVRSAFRQ